MTDLKDGAIQGDAIQKDAASKDASSDDGQVDQREEDFNAIVERVEEQRSKDLGIEPEQKPDEKIEKEPDLKPAEKKETQDQEDEMVDIVVDGEKSQVPKSKILDAGIRTFQKESAADQRLAEGKALLEEAKSLRQEVAKPATLAAPETDAKGGAADTSEADLLHAIRYGEDEEATAAIRTLKGRSDGFDPAEIAKIVNDTIENRKTGSIRERFEKSKELGGFADISSDPINYNYARTRVEALVNSGKGSYDDWETYQAAGQWVREVILGEKPAEPAGEDPPSGGKKTDLKEGLTTITPATTTDDDQKPGEPTTAAQDRSKAIKDMQKQRDTGRY